MRDILVIKLDIKRKLLCLTFLCSAYNINVLYKATRLYKISETMYMQKCMYQYIDRKHGKVTKGCFYQRNIRIIDIPWIHKPCKKKVERNMFDILIFLVVSIRNFNGLWIDANLCNTKLIDMRVYERTQYICMFVPTCVSGKAVHKIKYMHSKSCQIGAPKPMILKRIDC